MSLKNSGDHLEKLARLSKWLRGQYSATDFMPSNFGEEESVRIKREMSRTALIDQACTAFIDQDNYDRHYPHPLSGYRDIPISGTDAESTSADHTISRLQELPQLQNKEVAVERTDEKATCALLQQVLGCLDKLSEQVVTLTARTERLETERRTAPPASSTRVINRDS